MTDEKRIKKSKLSSTSFGLKSLKLNLKKTLAYPFVDVIDFGLQVHVLGRIESTSELFLILETTLVLVENGNLYVGTVIHILRKIAAGIIQFTFDFRIFALDVDQTQFVWNGSAGVLVLPNLQRISVQFQNGERVHRCEMESRRRLSVAWACAGQVKNGQSTVVDHRIRCAASVEKFVWIHCVHCRSSLKKLKKTEQKTKMYVKIG